MNPEKIESMPIVKIREGSIGSILEWFNKHKKLFYMIALSYVRDQQLIEEIFYRSIKNVHKQRPRMKIGLPFNLWVTSTFIHTCNEFSNSLQASQEVVSRPELLQSLDSLQDNQKRVLILILAGNSLEDVASVLQVSSEEVKGLLYSAIRSLKNESGYNPSSLPCEYHTYYIDYLEKTLERSVKIDFEVHIHHCQECQEELGAFQDVMVNLTNMMKKFHVPSGFIENVQARFAEREKRRQQKNKKRKRITLSFVSAMLVMISIGIFTGSFTNVYYAWTEEDEELRTFLQHGLGEQLNLEAVSNGIKITIKSVIADDIQTLIFYEIEDTEDNHQYMVDFYDGVFVEDERNIMNRDTFRRYYPPDFKSKLNNKEKNLYYGKVGLHPLKEDNGTINLKLTKLHKLIRDSSYYGEYKTGEWNFELPVTKQPLVEYPLNEETEIDGIPVQFEKLVIAPTTTILEFAFKHEHPEKQVLGIHLDNLRLNNQKVEVDRSGSNYIMNHDRQWISFQTNFEPLFEEKANELNIQFESVHSTVIDRKSIELDPAQSYPQTFEYAESTISIDKVEIGQPSEIVISDHDTENRAYQSFFFDVVGEDENSIVSREINSEGVIIDKYGNEYDMYQFNQVEYEEIEQPRHYITVQHIKLHSDDGEESVIPKHLEIYEYQQLKYLDDIVKISLE